MLKTRNGRWFIAEACFISMLVALPLHAADEDTLVIEDGNTEVIEEEGAELIIEESTDGDEIVIEDGSSEDELIVDEEIESDELIIEDSGEDAVVLEEEGEIDLSEDDLDGDELVIDDDVEGEELVLDDDMDDGSEITEDDVDAEPFSFRVDDLWIEYGYLGDDDARGRDLGYLHAKATAKWNPSENWEFQISARVDGYSQSGKEDVDNAKLDYDETYVRYRSDDYRITVGTQTIIWGRIDEFPPTDRLSTFDLKRYVLDDLADRRRASPAIRIESFIGDSKLDFVYLPDFREAELPSKDSVWYPVDRDRGEIFGLKSTPVSAAIISSAPIDDSAPDTDGGFGLRFSGVGEELDYSVSLQRVRQSIPYFSFNPSTGVLEARHPRSWIVGGDLEFEAGDATWRMEAAWSSDTPVTRIVGGYTTINSLNWGLGVEFYPGDGDTRLNLQLTGINLINAPNITDREEVYSFNGSVEIPFAEDRWRFKTRFYFGLDEKDVYINPEIAYTGWESQELYLEGHYFDGADGTPGGFHENNSLVTLGWRVKF